MKRLTTRIALDEISDHKTYLLCHSYIRNSELMQKIRELLQSVIRSRSNFEEHCAQCNYKKIMNGLLLKISPVKPPLEVVDTPEYL